MLIMMNMMTLHDYDDLNDPPVHDDDDLVRVSSLAQPVSDLPLRGAVGQSTQLDSVAWK